VICCLLHDLCDSCANLWSQLFHVELEVKDGGGGHGGGRALTVAAEGSVG
jgi:hypothetical protein